MSALSYGSLFSGVGLLDLAIEEVFDATAAWHCELDPNASKVLEHHWPGVPNLGDITAIDWADVAPVDIICGGSPCQDLSSAGKRAGMAPGTRSGLWAAMCRAIDAIRPSLVIWENVHGALSAPAACELEPDPRPVVRGPGVPPLLRAAGRVLGDLASLGFDAEWTTVRASDVGAPHRRSRVFIVAWPADANPRRLISETVRRREDGRPHPDRPAGQPPRPGGPFALIPTPTASDAKGPSPSHSGTTAEAIRDLLPTPSASNTNDGEALANWTARRARVKESSTAGNGSGVPLSIAVRLLPSPRTSDTKGAGVHGDGGLDLRTAVTLLPTPTGAPTTGNGHARNLGAEAKRLMPTPTVGDSKAARHSTARRLVTPPTGVHAGDTLTDAATIIDQAATGRFGPYAGAIARWEAMCATPAPDPTDAKGRLSPLFVEWMMGAPAGHVTNLLQRPAALRALGNSVVRQQAAHAIRGLLARAIDERAAA